MMLQIYHVFCDLHSMNLHFQFMQKVGKLDETKDEVFDEFVNNFNKQQVSACYSKPFYFVLLSAYEVFSSSFKVTEFHK